MSNMLVTELVYKGFKVEVEYDHFHDLTVEEFGEQCQGDLIYCSLFHRTSCLRRLCPFTSEDEVFLYAGEKGWKIYNLFRYQHGEIRFSAYAEDEAPRYPFNDPWDAGLEGFVIASPDIELKQINTSLQCLADLCNGNVYFYRIINEDGEEVDACAGIIGIDSCLELAKESCDWLKKEEGGNSFPFKRK